MHCCVGLQPGVHLLSRLGFVPRECEKQRPRLSEAVILSIFFSCPLQCLTRVVEIVLIDVGPRERGKPVHVLRILFEHPLLLTDRAVNVALLPEKLTKAQVRRPVQG